MPTVRRLNLGGEGEFFNFVNQQPPAALHPEWTSCRNGLRLHVLAERGHQFLVCPNDRLCVPDASVDIVLTNNVPVDGMSWLGPCVQTAEIRRVLAPGGRWLHNGVELKPESGATADAREAARERINEVLSGGRIFNCPRSCEPTGEKWYLIGYSPDSLVDIRLVEELDYVLGLGDDFPGVFIVDVSAYGDEDDVTRTFSSLKSWFQTPFLKVRENKAWYPTFSGATARSILERDFRIDLTNLFADIDCVPYPS